MDLLKRFTIKNLKLNKKRTIVTIIGIILSVALITAVGTMFMSARASLIEYEVQTKGNFHAVFRDVDAKEINDFTLNRKVSEVFLSQNLGYSKLDGIKNEYKPYIYVRAYSKASMENLGVNITQGRLPENENEIVIPNHLDTNGGLELELGDKIYLEVGQRQSGEDILNQVKDIKQLTNSKLSKENESKTYYELLHKEDYDWELENLSSMNDAPVEILNKANEQYEKYKVLTYQNALDEIEYYDIEQINKELSEISSSISKKQKKLKKDVFEIIRNKFPLDQ